MVPTPLATDRTYAGSIKRWWGCLRDRLVDAPIRRATGRAFLGVHDAVRYAVASNARLSPPARMHGSSARARPGATAEQYSKPLSSLLLKQAATV